jgi:ATP phosphoribosyltransferase
MTIRLGLPSKGRLKEQSLEALAGFGINVRQDGDARKYSADIEGLPGVDVAFLSASEIARELAAGTIDMGVTGEDLLRETIADFDLRVSIPARLGFGHADVVVAVPDSWIDVVTMADLDDVAAEFRQRHGRRLRIATKYWRLTQSFFSGQHGIQVYRIVESLGATEGAPAAGQADIIVDITSTGSTLNANHLRILEDGVMLKSEACLALTKRERTDEDAALVLSVIEKFS